MTTTNQSHDALITETAEQRQARLKAFYSGMTKRVLASQKDWGADVPTSRRLSDEEFDYRAAQTGAVTI